MKLLVDKKGRKYLVKDGNDLHCSYGMVSATDIESAGVGGVAESNKGEPFNVLEPDVLDFIAKAKRGPQAMTLKDMGLIAAYAGLGPGSKVVEAGTGSGLLTMYLAHVVAPAKVVTFDVREDHAEIAGKNFGRFGFTNIDSRVGDVYEGIPLEGLDAVLLDLAEPWRALPHAQKALKVGGRLISYSPSINQSRQLIEVLDGFSHETFEAIKRNWKPSTMRPDTRMLGHTGFLTVARKLK